MQVFFLRLTRDYYNHSKSFILFHLISETLYKGRTQKKNTGKNDKGQFYFSQNIYICETVFDNKNNSVSIYSLILFITFILPY